MKNSELHSELTNEIIDLTRLTDEIPNGSIKTLIEQAIAKLVYARADITPWDGELEDPLADMEDDDQEDMFSVPDDQGGLWGLPS